MRVSTKLYSTESSLIARWLTINVATICSMLELDLCEPKKKFLYILQWKWQCYTVLIIYEAHPDKSVIRFIGQNAAISTNDWCHVLLRISFWTAFGKKAIDSLNLLCLRLVKNIWAPISYTYSSKPQKRTIL